MTLHITSHRSGFPLGYTAITRIGEPDADAGIEFGVLELAEGQSCRFDVTRETAFLLMEGTIGLHVEGVTTAPLTRTSLFDESATCLHVSAGQRVAIDARGGAQLTMFAVDNDRRFEARLYLPKDVPNEHRGKGQVADACYRFVRTIFDRRNAPEAANLVLGEVITFPGRWSSYPPHHHAQPEIYHYRFTRPEGFGHAELGDTVLKVRQYDTVKILDGVDHPQCAAPGYGMYYLWVIRHLPGDPYGIPEFTAEHRWTLERDARMWQPRGVAAEP
ncbi:MAG: 5-deoxy-glucuronate isomerase [Alphaproteobacteria bacterium]